MDTNGFTTLVAISTKEDIFGDTPDLIVKSMHNIYSGESGPASTRQALDVARGSGSKQLNYTQVAIIHHIAFCWDSDLSKQFQTPRFAKSLTLQIPFSNSPLFFALNLSPCCAFSSINPNFYFHIWTENFGRINRIMIVNLRPRQVFLFLI